MANDEVLNAEQAADLLKFHVEYVRELARQGKIPAVKVGGSWRFVREEIINWLRAGAPAQPRRLKLSQ